MKKIISITLGILMSLSIGSSFYSCSDYLDVDEYFQDLISLDSAFAKRKYVDAWLSNAYQHMQQDLGEFEGYMKYASDDVITYDQKGKDLQNGKIDFTDSDYSKRYERIYEAIRKSSTFINNVDKCGEMTKSEISDYKAQARFLRAYSYWTLIREFGPVPLVPAEGLDVSLSYEELSLPRAHFDEVVDFIDQDLVLAALNLPTARTANNLGRPSKGAALALRARVMLYAASPLFNGNSDLFNVKNKDGKQLVSQDYDESKWARAAAAAKEVIDLGVYDLAIVKLTLGTPDNERPPYNAEYSDKNYPEGWADIDPCASYKANFDGNLRGSKNTELIFTRTYIKETITNIAKDGVPKSLKGNNKLGITQKAVDAFYMNDGRTIEEALADGYYKLNGFTTTAGEYPFVPLDVSLMYVNREPRFYASVAYSGTLWVCESANETQYKNQQVFYYRDGTDGKQGFKEECPLTGVGFKKYNNDEDAYTTGGYRVDKTEPTIRYAEILLAYAEALNELSPGKTYTVKSYKDDNITVGYDVEAIRNSIKPIRMRAGLPDYSVAEYTNKNNLRLKMKRERQIEFIGEGTARYRDLRRWKDALVEENKPIQGCNINIPKDDAVKQNFYKSVVVTSVPKSFSQKMYLLPFPQQELKKNVNLTQNPGW